MVREGTDLTVVTYGAVVQRALVAAKELEEKDGRERRGHRPAQSLSPVDWETIEPSVRKTNRVIVAYEDSLSWGYGAEIAARIADECFPWLDAPGEAGGLDRHLRRLRARARGRHSAAGRRISRGPCASCMRSRPVLGYSLLFFLSGATGLVYELLWVRLLYQSFGSTIQSVTTVVAAYMGGLGLGRVAAGAARRPAPAIRRRCTAGSRS